MAIWDANCDVKEIVMSKKLNYHFLTTYVHSQRQKCAKFAH